MADPRRRRILAGAASLVASAALLAGCGGAPDQAEFTAKIKDSIGTDLIDGMKSQHIDAATGQKLIDDFVDCQYDSIKDDADLLQKAYDDPGDANIAAQLDTKAAACVQTLSTAMAKATGTTTTTTTTPTPEVPPSTVFDTGSETIDTIAPSGETTVVGTFDPLATPTTVPGA